MTATSVSKFGSFNPAKAIASLQKMAAKESPSSARYTVLSGDNPYSDVFGPCYHSVSSYVVNNTGLAVVFMGYSGFKSGDKFRRATQQDILTDQDYPFTYTTKCYYNDESKAWLGWLLDEAGAFKDLLPHMLTTDADEIQQHCGFIFPDVHKVPARLLWCFLIASRIGVANARVLWQYIFLREAGVEMKMASLVCGGFAPEVVTSRGTNGLKYEVTGQIIKSYTAGWLGVDTTAYAHRWLDIGPVTDKAMGASRSIHHTNGSSKVFQSAKVDMKNLRFPDWNAVVEYTLARNAEQAGSCMAEAA